MADIDGVAGIDAHKHVFTVAVLDARGGRCGIESCPTSPDGVAAVLGRSVPTVRKRLEHFAELGGEELSVR